MELKDVKLTSKKYKEQEERYTYEVEKTGEYEYIRSYRKNEILPNGNIVKHCLYLQIKHKYCGSTYEVQAGHFINRKDKCPKCCGSYEKSFAYHIEVELGEPLEKYWDFNKNILNPCHIWKSNNKKVWIKCQEKDYHGSYEIGCGNFVNGKRCSYCNPRKKVHPKDSFAQYHIDNTDKDFLNKYWDYDKNTLDPFTISQNSLKAVWIKCQDYDYHSSYKVTCDSFTGKGIRCKTCCVSKGEKCIRLWLDRNKFKYIHDESCFDGLIGVGGGMLRPDFILPNERIWIEYDGEFHYRKMYDDDNYEDLKIHDKRKNKYAEEYKWKMIRIPYWDYDNIEEILENKLCPTNELIVNV